MQLLSRRHRDGVAQFRPASPGECNSHLLEILADRELNNAGYYDRLCAQWEKEIQDSNDVLIEAERIRRKIGGSGDLVIGSSGDQNPRS